MQQNYDDELLLKLPHLKLHKNYLPHIGKNFEDALQRIMIVAESHYVPKDFNGLITADRWHSEPETIYLSLGKYAGWFNTRAVLQTYFRDRKLKKVSGGLTIFKNLESAYKTAFNNRDLMDECVYLNYYQRPAEKQGDSINANLNDSKIAMNNLLTLIEVLKVNKIIFVSSKAYADFKSMISIEILKTLPYIGSVPHPSASSWWNRKSLKYGINGNTATGKEKFERIVRLKGSL